MAAIEKVIGLMSGTSLDGVDAALIETDGGEVARPLSALTIPYDEKIRALLRSALDEARGAAAAAVQGAAVPVLIERAERRLTEAHAQAVRALLHKTGLGTGEISLLGFHGQTILHRPEQGWTWQIGDGPLLARLTGIDVVNDFRSADVKAGGQGAPLMPFYHLALVGKARFPAPQAVVNVGGVAQVTYIWGDTVMAFDTGPGNGPIDDWMLRHSGRPLDQDGGFARRGKVQDATLDRMLAHPFFTRKPPKSLDRLDFGMEAVEGLSPEDGAATLTAFTAAALARATEHFPKCPAIWIVSGGGRHNRFLMDQLRDRVTAPVIGADEAGWDGDFMEAEGFAYLAMRSRRGLPLSLPSTTGVREPKTGGKFHPKR
ncbi:MAG: anhydro-N-acetylmuramic acid kinase [Rhizomicrobium sp.]